MHWLARWRKLVKVDSLLQTLVKLLLLTLCLPLRHSLFGSRASAMIVL